MDLLIELRKCLKKPPSKNSCNNMKRNYVLYRSLEPIDAIKSLEFYKDSCAVYESEDRIRFSLDTFKHAISFAIRSKQYLILLMSSSYF